MSTTILMAKIRPTREIPSKNQSLLNTRRNAAQSSPVREIR
jgi:hypothetical protein